MTRRSVGLFRCWFKFQWLIKRILPLSQVVAYFVIVFYSLIVGQYSIIFCPKLFQVSECSWRWGLLIIILVYYFFICMFYIRRMAIYFSIVWRGHYGMNSFWKNWIGKNSLVSCFTFGLACFKRNPMISALKKGQELWNSAENHVKILLAICHLTFLNDYSWLLSCVSLEM